MVVGSISTRGNDLHFHFLASSLYTQGLQVRQIVENGVLEYFAKFEPTQLCGKNVKLPKKSTTLWSYKSLNKLMSISLLIFQKCIDI